MKLAVAVELDAESDGPGTWAEGAVDLASRWMMGFTGHLDVIHVARAPIVPPGLSREGALRRVVEAELDQVRRRDAGKLAALVGRIPEDHRGVARLLEGAPVEALVEAGDGYDGLFVATHGRSGLAHFWLGSIAEDVVRLSRCAVIVLRLPTKGG